MLKYARSFQKWPRCNPIVLVRHASTRSAKAKWYHSTDIPISKPEWFEYTPEKKPEKFVPFLNYDSARLERAFEKSTAKVDVKEDRLFQVDLAKMELAPVYWPGPVYEVRRGTWFTAEGVPLSAEVTEKLEKGFQTVSPEDLGPPPQPDFSEEFAKSPKAAMAKFEKEVKAEYLTEAIDIGAEKDVIDLGDGNAAVFFDKTSGAIFPKEFGKFQLNVIRSLQPKLGSLMSVVPIQRGYTEGLDSSIIENVKSAKVASLLDIFLEEILKLFSKDDAKQSESSHDNDQSKLLQNVLEADYEHAAGDSASKREVDHVVFCIHGIGQILGYKYESVNFTHSVNVLRNTMRDVYKNEKKYQKLAYGDECDYKNDNQKNNNRIQVLPISWRHEVSFHPKRPFELKNEKGKPRLPSLSDINVDGVASLRDVVGDVLLDILLYYEPTYLKEIMRGVVAEINRVHKLYMEKNPDFKGKIHVLGHSLGSAIAFDLLAYQKDKKDKNNEYQLDFDVENLFCVGSPVGVFKLLQQKNIFSRIEAGEQFDPTDLSSHISLPKCQNLYNVFHPCDPVGYRMEPLVDPQFANFKAELIPFAMEGFNTKVQSLSSLGDDFSEKILQASSWFRSDSKPVKQASSVENEDALKDVISSLTSTRGNKASTSKTKAETFSKEDMKQLFDLNRTGRVDYSLPMGVFSIALVSAIGAHVSYFEDEETAGFVMKEILSSNLEPLQEREVQLYK